MANRVDPKARSLLRKLGELVNQGEPIILVVETEVSVRVSIEQVLRSAGYTVEAFSCIERFLRKSSQDGSGCMLLDFSIPGHSGLDLLKRLQGAGWSLPIIFLSETSSVPLSVEAIKCGAADFLVKPLDWTLMLHAVEEAVRLSRRLCQAKRELDLLKSLVASLTPREMEVFDDVTAGYLNKQIAQRLGIAEKTIKVHRGRVMKKLQARSIAELVRFAESLKVDPHEKPQPVYPSQKCLVEPRKSFSYSPDLKQLQPGLVP